MAPVSMSRKAAAIGLAFAASALFSAPAMAQEGSLIQGLFGALGMTAPERPSIEYRERAPLVVPPTRDLPPPVAPDNLTANPQWPDDVSLRAARARAEPYVSSNENPRLSMDEVRAARRVGGSVQDFTTQTDEEISRPLTPAEMRITHRSPQTAQGLTRRFLTDPPNTFLQPAPSN